MRIAEERKNSHKIAIIIIRQSDEYVRQMQRYLEALHIPAGYEAEILLSSPEGGLAHAFAAGMHASDAKYKVYIPPQTVIVHERLLEDCLAIFQYDADSGAIGVLGAGQLSTTTELYRSYHLQGRLLFGDGGQIIPEGGQEKLSQVQILSENIFVTQYDVPWREAAGMGDDYVFRAQSIEFTRCGYKLVVPPQDDFWVIGSLEHSEESTKAAFLAEYAKDIYPLISIVIPTYERPEYFRQALDSVLAQDYCNLDIFITDNSHNDDTEQLMQAHYLGDERIKYIHNREWGAKENWESALGYNNPQAEYVNWLMDDDIFMPGKLSVMMEYFFQYPQVGMVTSYRGRINAEGGIIEDRQASLPDGGQVVYMNGRDAGRQMLLAVSDDLGEPTTPLLKKKYMRDGYTLGWNIISWRYFVVDFTTWLNMLMTCDCLFLLKSYSYFRDHEGSSSKQWQTQCAIFICWADCIKKAIDDGIYLVEASDKQQSITTWLTRVGALLQEVGRNKYYSNYVEDLQIVYAAMENALQNGYKIEFKLRNRYDA